MPDPIEQFAHECDSQFLADLLGASLEGTAGADGHTLEATSHRSHVAPGMRIGRYKLLQQIGEGGMGVVFMAEQEQPVHRRVALKVIKPGMDSRQVIARFEAERQALAVMDHPNIAKVLDAGSTDAGRPYFVMELVRGTPITEYCDQQQLTTRDRLELLVPVCQAVQHAHGKGIIHRDLKPSNVLITIADGRPVPKVIDFGVAKATQSRLTEKTLFTEFRQLLGTPQYMSPEQAESNGIDVDTRSDVYSLGVLLYELLTGTTPLDGKLLRSKAYAEMEKLIRECEPPSPSTRLSTLGDAAKTIATQRKTEPQKLNQLLRGELDWIVLKALEKDRSRRYETANGLARDIQRYLTDEPVEACPPSASYKFKKFVRKHRAPLGVAACFFLVVTAAAVISTAMAFQAIRAKTTAQQLATNELTLRKDAQRFAAAESVQRKQAEAVAKVLESVFSGLSPYSQGTDLKTRLVTRLDEISTNLDKDYSGDPLLRAHLRNTLGLTQRELGEHGKAKVLFEAASDERRRYAGEDDPGTLTTLENLADELQSPGERIALRQKVLEGRKKRLGLDDPATLRAMSHLGAEYWNDGRYAAGLKLLEQTRDAQNRKLGATDLDTLSTVLFLAQVYDRAGRITESIRLHGR